MFTTVQFVVEAKESFNNVFESLRRMRGPSTMQFFAGCLLCTRHGLTQDELEDAMSLEDGLLNETFLRLNFLPSVRRFPTMELVGIVRDLKNFLNPPLTQDGVADILSWKITIRPAVERICGDVTRKLCAGVLADYFAGTWAGEVSKPYTNSLALCKQLGLSETGSAMRHVAMQPHVFPRNLGSVRGPAKSGLQYNARKVMELPRHLRDAQRWDDIVELCLANYEFLLAKMSVVSFDVVMADFDVQYTNGEVELFRPLVTALRSAQHVLEVDPYQIAGQLAARLLPPFDQRLGVAGIAAVLLEAARLRGGRRELALMPRFALTPTEDVAVADLRGVAGHTGEIHALAVASGVLLSVGDDKAVKLWTATGRLECQHTLVVSKDWLRAVALTPDAATAIVGSWDATVTVLDVSDGLHVRQTITGHDSYVNTVCVSADGKLALTGSDDNTAIVWNTADFSMISRFLQHKDSILSAAIHSVARLVLTGDRSGVVHAWDPDSAKVVMQFNGHVKAVTVLLFSRNGRQLFSGSEDFQLRVWDLPVETGTPVKDPRIVRAHGDTITAVLATLDGDHVLTTSLDCDVKLWFRETISIIAVFTASSPIHSAALVGDTAMPWVAIGFANGLLGGLHLWIDIDDARLASSFLADAALEGEAGESGVRGALAYVRRASKDLKQSSTTMHEKITLKRSTRAKPKFSVASLSAASASELLASQMRAAKAEELASRVSATLKGFSGQSDVERLAEERRAQFEHAVFVSSESEEPRFKRPSFQDAPKLVMVPHAEGGLAGRFANLSAAEPAPGDAAGAAGGIGVARGQLSHSLKILNPLAEEAPAIDTRALLLRGMDQPDEHLEALQAVWAQNETDARTAKPKKGSACCCDIL